MEMLAGSGYIAAMDKHPKRPRDPSQLAKMIVDMASGERPEKTPKPPAKKQGASKKAKLKKG